LPARHTSSPAVAAYSNEMFQAFGYPKQCLVLTNNGVDGAVPAAMSTLRTPASAMADATIVT
jgi:hypothetical protein